MSSGRTRPSGCRGILTSRPLSFYQRSFKNAQQRPSVKRMLATETKGPVSLDKMPLESLHKVGLRSPLHRENSLYPSAQSKHWHSPLQSNAAVIYLHLHYYFIIMLFYLVFCLALSRRIALLFFRTALFLFCCLWFVHWSSPLQVG